MLCVDPGVSVLAVAFDGAAFEDVAAPRHLRKAQKRLRRAQRALSRRRKGSARRRAQARRVGGVIHRKVRERCKDLLHQISHRLTTRAGVVKVETLNVKGMARNRHLALSGVDAGMSRLAASSPTRPTGGGTDRPVRSVVSVQPDLRQVRRAASGNAQPVGADPELRLRQRHGPRSQCGGEPLLVSRGAGEPDRQRSNARGDGRSGACSVPVSEARISADEKQ